MKFLTLSLFCLLAFETLQANEIKERSEEIIRESFNYQTRLEITKFELPVAERNKIEQEVKQKFYRESVYLWRIHQADSLVGYALLDNVYGKSLPITFMVIYDSKGSMLSVEIVKYRESHGGAVSNRSWLDQFIAGQSNTKEYAIGKNIDGISGATISASAITKGVYKLGLLLSEILTEDRTSITKK